MPVRTVLGVEDGAPVVRTVADGDDAPRLQARADALVAAAGPGVVATVRSGPADDGWELVTAHGGLPLAGSRLAGAAALAGIGASAAGTLAELHRRGLGHGRLGARHVLVGVDGAARLCGLAGDDERAHVAPADDVAALARVLAAALAELPARPSRAEQERRDRLAALLADATTTPLPAGRVAAALRAVAGLGAPVARGGRVVPRTSSAAGLGAPVARGGRVVPRTSPSAGLGAPVARGGRVVPRTSLSPRAVVAGLGALAAAVLVIGIVGLGATGGSARQRARPPSTSTAPATSSSSTTTTVPTCVVGTRVPVARPPAAGACPHAISVEPGGAVVVDGRRAVVGRRGDEVLVGDWGCGGVAAAVLHLETGEALVYAPLDGDAPVVAMAERVAGATGLGAGVDDDGCPTLLVRTEEGSIRLT